MDTGGCGCANRQRYSLEKWRADLGGTCKRLEVLVRQGHRRAQLACARKLLKKAEISYKVSADTMALYK